MFEKGPSTLRPGNERDLSGIPGNANHQLEKFIQRILNRCLEYQSINLRFVNHYY